MSAENFLKNLFGIHVAVLCSEDAQKSAHKNNLTFCEMLRPFSQLPIEVSIRDQQGHVFYAKGISVKFSEPARDVSSDAKLRLLLDSAVHDTESLIPEAEGRRGYSPWYEHYRDTFLEHMQVGQQEYLRHYLCNLFVVSSKSEDVMGECKRLQDSQIWMREHYTYSHWFNQAVDYYLVLHDNLEGDVNRTQGIMSKLKSQYGNRCSVLAINSRSLEEKEASFLNPWSRFIFRKSALSEVQSPTKVASLGKVPPSSSTHLPPLPNGPLKTSEAREEAQLVDLEDTAPSGGDREPPAKETKELLDPLLHPGLDEADRPAEPLSSGRDASAAAFGQFCTSDDHETLRKFVVDLTKQILLSTLNVMQKALSEPVQARKASVGKLWNKSWKSIRNMTSTGAGQPIHTYQSDSHELQARQLADVSLLLHNYDYAYQLYHNLKGDFKSDRAWLHYAGALELSAISCFMYSQKVNSTYFDDAVNLYLNSASSPHFSFRTQLVYCELLKSQRRFREAALMFVCISSDSSKNVFLSNSDLKSALAFEEAANCFLQDGMQRKYCLYIMLAAHRYNKARHPVHGARALKSALSVLDGKAWSLSEAYIQTTLARHFCQRDLFEGARQGYESILTNADHRHTMSMQLPLCKEYIYVLQQIFSSHNHLDLRGSWSREASELSLDYLPHLVLPSVEPSQVTVVFSSHSTCPDCSLLSKAPPAITQHSTADNPDLLSTSDLSAPSSTLSDLICRSRNRPSDPSFHSASLTGGAADQLEHLDLKRARTLERRAAGCALEENAFEHSVLFMSSRTRNTQRPFCAINEPVAIQVTLKNHLQIPLLLTDLTLVWKLEPLNPGMALAPGDSVLTEIVSKVTLESSEQKMVRFHVIPLKEGVVHIVGVVYTLSINQSSPALQQLLIKERATSQPEDVGVQGFYKLHIQGPRLNESMLDRASVLYGTDHRLSWTVCSPAPQLKVNMTNCPSWMLAGEVSLIPMNLENVGERPLKELTFSICRDDGFCIAMGNQQVGEGGARPNAHPSRLVFNLSGDSKACLCPGHAHQSEALLQASRTPRNYTVDWIFHYRPDQEIAGLNHRVVPFSHQLLVEPSLGLSCVVHPSYVGPRTSRKAVLLALEMDNLCPLDTIPGNKLVEIRILQFTCIGRSAWSVHPLDPNQGPIVLKPGQTGFVTCKASCDSKKRTSAEEGEGGGVAEEEREGSLKFFNHSLGAEKVVDLGVFPSYQLFAQSSEYRELMTEAKQQSSGRGGERSIVLAVLWEASIPIQNGIRTTYGVHYAKVDLPPSVCLPPEMMNEPNGMDPGLGSVQWCLSHPLQVQNNFATNRVAHMSVQLMLSNISSKPITVRVVVTPEPSPSDSKEARSGAWHMQWLGLTDWQQALQPFEGVSTLRDVCFVCPSVYELSNHVNVYIVRPPANGGGGGGGGGGDGTPLFAPQTCLQKSIVTVTDSKYDST